ncbi:hypothetical protein PS15m_012321 [Mucor circinelloides]
MPFTSSIRQLQVMIKVKGHHSWVEANICTMRSLKMCLDTSSSFALFPQAAIRQSFNLYERLLNNNVVYNNFILEPFSQATTEIAIGRSDVVSTIIHQCVMIHKKTKCFSIQASRFMILVIITSDVAIIINVQPR